MPLLQDENPLTYFLTPPTPKHEELEFEFDFDAGIEDASHPREYVRSISPSTLDGLKKYKPRGSEPSSRSDCAILDDDEDDDDDEDYIRLQPSQPLPFGFETYFDQPRQPLSKTPEALLSPPTFHVGSLSHRPSKRFAPPRRPFRGRSQTIALTRRHSWREPSPDVWSIDEEPEKETMSERGLSLENLADAYKTQPIDIPAAKPTKKVKKVRFILPTKE
ncbi:uncharacterized protein B0I36DRAFT_348000 [Microdochium trichocladiopsis]|uniref:Uncharacterized protein n=1 Tax=Microdochium trichocladiopsis TaxID=1682393 RepID=A0A9P8Y8V2_9PEZI|nr:uncharacterized protein B0I36DRAFT_348000 [Microdochium trichocladiopsis]KAH7032841.1 hypothetical protein B0I36DRAFT_348000 [Microdochium trichocladiopsis]